jgi:hypothetical protein
VAGLLTSVRGQLRSSAIEDLGSKATSDHSQCTALTQVDKMRRFNLAQSSLNTIAKRYSSDMAQNYIKRVTLFKVPKPEHIDEARTNEEV